MQELKARAWLVCGRRAGGSGRRDHDELLPFMKLQSGIFLISSSPALPGEGRLHGNKYGSGHC